MKFLLNLVFLIFISGCASKTIVSSDPDFSGFVSRSIVLTKPVLVCSDGVLNTKSVGNVEYRLLYNTNDINACPFGKTIGKLSIGSGLYIMSIEKHRVSSLKSPAKVYFVGTANLSGFGEFTFYYLYGYEGYYENKPW
jgi:hypothetical protein